MSILPLEGSLPDGGSFAMVMATRAISESHSAADSNLLSVTVEGMQNKV